MAAIVCVVNRTEHPLSYTKGGAQVTLAPGENHIPIADVRFALTQNVIMGSENPLNPMQFESFIGVKGHKKYVCTPVALMLNKDKKPIVLFDDGREVLLKSERFDRSKLPNKKARAAVEEDADVIISRYNITDMGPTSLDERVDSTFSAD